MLVQEHVPAQLAVLIGHRIVECVGSDVSPISIKPDFERGCPSARHFEDARGDSKPNVGGGHFDTCNPFGYLPAFFRSESRPIGRVLAVESSELITYTISQGLSGSEVCEEVPISLKNVELVGGGFFVVASKRPGTGQGGSIFRSELQTPDSNAQVKVAED